MVKINIKMYATDSNRAVLRKHDKWFLPDHSRMGFLNESRTYSIQNADEIVPRDTVVFTVAAYSSVDKCRVDVTFAVHITATVEDGFTLGAYCHDLYESVNSGDSKEHGLRVMSESIQASECLRATFAPITARLKRDLLADGAVFSTENRLASFLRDCGGVDSRSIHEKDMTGLCIVSDGLRVNRGTGICERVDAAEDVPLQYMIRFTRAMLTSAVHASFSTLCWYYLIAPTGVLRINSDDHSTVEALLNDGGEDDSIPVEERAVTRDLVVKLHAADAITTTALVLIEFNATRRGAA